MMDHRGERLLWLTCNHQALAHGYLLYLHHTFVLEGVQIAHEWFHVVKSNSSQAGQLAAAQRDTKAFTTLVKHLDDFRNTSLILVSTLSVCALCT